MPFRQVTVSGFPALALRGAEIEAVVVPVLGMKLTNLRRFRGREWLWRSDQTPLAPGIPGASYVETADSGGWDECFPTVGPCPVPGRPAAPPLPDHGELWSARWESAVSEHAGGTTLTGTVKSARFPCELQRAVTLDAHAPAVRFQYRLRHLGGDPFPWIWSSHPLLNVQPGTTLELPGVTQARVDSAHGRPGLSHGDVVGWPAAISGESGRFTVPHRSAGWAVKLFADIGPSGRAILIDPREGERLEFRIDPATVPQIGLWINCGGWAPDGRTPYFNLAVEPCIGAPDRLDQAVEEWHAAQLLSAGEERTWSLEVALPGE
jgi:galactose mutarotase-like enzyme